VPHPVVRSVLEDSSSTTRAHSSPLRPISFVETLYSLPSAGCGNSTIGRGAGGGPSGHHSAAGYCSGVDQFPGSSLPSALVGVLPMRTVLPMRLRLLQCLLQRLVAPECMRRGILKLGMKLSLCNSGLRKPLSTRHTTTGPHTNTHVKSNPTPTLYHPQIRIPAQHVDCETHMGSTFALPSFTRVNNPTTRPTLLSPSSWHNTMDILQ